MHCNPLNLSTENLNIFQPLNLKTFITQKTHRELFYYFFSNNYFIAKKQFVLNKNQSVGH